MATVIKCDLLSNISDVEIEKGVDIVTTPVSIDREVVVVIDRDDASSLDEMTIIKNVSRKLKHTQS